jgi:hypothetical protein
MHTLQGYDQMVGPVDVELFIDVENGSPAMSIAGVAPSP